MYLIFCGEYFSLDLHGKGTRTYLTGTFEWEKMFMKIAVKTMEAWRLLLDIFLFSPCCVKINISVDTMGFVFDFSDLSKLYLWKKMNFFKRYSRFLLAVSSNIFYFSGFFNVPQKVFVWIRLVVVAQMLVSMEMRMSLDPSIVCSQCLCFLVGQTWREEAVIAAALQQGS